MKYFAALIPSAGFDNVSLSVLPFMVICGVYFY